FACGARRSSVSEKLSEAGSSRHTNMPPNSLHFVTAAQWMTFSSDRSLAQSAASSVCSTMSRALSEKSGVNESRADIWFSGNHARSAWLKGTLWTIARSDNGELVKDC